MSQGQKRLREDEEEDTPTKIVIVKEPSEKKPSAHRIQHFREEWLNQFDWVSPVKGNTLRSFCIYCEAYLNAEVTVLKRHEKSTKHRLITKDITPGNRENIALTSYYIRPKRESDNTNTSPSISFSNVRPREIFKKINNSDKKISIKFNTGTGFKEIHRPKHENIEGIVISVSFYFIYLFTNLS